MIPISSTKYRYLNIEIVVYFSGGMNNLYQLEQWINPLIKLNNKLKILIVVRDIYVYQWLLSSTIFQVVYCKTMDSLLNLYETNDFKVILYVNNASSNFQSLMNNRALHVHINHGESEKTSTFSNRAKAYDRVFLVSDAGYEKYKNNLINISMDKFTKIGRPQLDWFTPIRKPKTKRKILLYGPTWEGAHLSMNYSSLVELGESIVETALSSDNYFLIYRPHPNTGSRDNQTHKVNLKIEEKVHNSRHAAVMKGGDINAIFSFTDIAIFDNSAISIDFLHYNKPIIMTDYFYRIEGRKDKPKITEACTLINKENIDNLSTIIDDEVRLDSNRNSREAMKLYFLGDYAQGESTDIFIQELLSLKTLRDRLLLHR